MGPLSDGPVEEPPGSPVLSPSPGPILSEGRPARTRRFPPLWRDFEATSLLQLQWFLRLTKRYSIKGLNNQQPRSQWQFPHQTYQYHPHIVHHLTGFVSVGSLLPAPSLRLARANPTMSPTYLSPIHSRMTRYLKWSRHRVLAHHQRQPKG